MNNQYIKKIMHVIGGKRCQTPRHIYERAPGVFGSSCLSKHSFTFRVSGSFVGWFEVWCNNSQVIANKNAIAHDLAARGFRVIFLPTRFSVRLVGERRPCLVTPIEGNANLQNIGQQLEAADYIGLQMEADDD